MLGSILGSAIGSAIGSPVAGAIIGSAIGGIAGGLLGGTGSPARRTTGPAYTLSPDVVNLLVDALKHPIATISYGGINKPLYDMVKINLLSRLLGVQQSSYEGEQSGWLFPAALGGYLGWHAANGSLAKSLLAKPDFWKTVIAGSKGSAIGTLVD